MEGKYTWIEPCEAMPHRCLGVEGEVQFTYSGPLSQKNMKEIVGQAVGDIADLFVYQYQNKNKQASYDFYTKISKLSQYSFCRVDLDVPQTGVFQLSVTQSYGGIEMQEEYQGIGMQPKLDRNPVELVAGEYIFELAKMRYVKAKITPSDETAKAIPVGYLNFDGEQKDIYRLDGDVIAQLKMVGSILVSVYSVSGKTLKEGHAELVSDKPAKGKQARTIRSDLKYDPDLDCRAQDGFFKNVFKTVEEVFFYPGVGELLEYTPRVTIPTVCHAILITLLVVAAIVVETLSAIYKWYIPIEFISYTAPAWVVGLVAFSLVFLVYATYLYYNPIAVDTAFKPKYSKLSKELDPELFKARQVVRTLRHEDSALSIGQSPT